MNKIPKSITRQRRKAKIRNLAKGNTNLMRKRLHEKKAGGHQTFW